MNCYPFIEAEKAGRRNVKRACALLKVSRAAFYAHQAGPSPREQEDAELTEQVQAIHDQSKGRYRAPRVHAELRRRGRHHSRKRVARPRRWMSSYTPAKRAVLRRPLEPKQYTSAEFASLAGDCDVTLSLGRTGQCWDNALSESFFASLKGELIDLQAWPTRNMARRAIVEYIGWYNGTRLHSTLGYKTPAEFEEDTKIKKVA